MDIHTRLEYPRELIQPEIKPENRTGTIEQLAQNVEAVEKQVQSDVLEVANYKAADLKLKSLVMRKRTFPYFENVLLHIRGCESVYISEIEFLGVIK